MCTNLILKHFYKITFLLSQFLVGRIHIYTKFKFYVFFCFQRDSNSCQRIKIIFPNEQGYLELQYSLNLYTYMEKQSYNEKQGMMGFNYNSGSSSKENQSMKRNFKIADRFILKCPMLLDTFYRAYKGIDLSHKKYVTIYIKPSSKQKLFSKNIKEELRQKIAPPLKWAGTDKIDKNIFDIQVHSRYGPSLFQILGKYKQKISDKTFYLLAYHSLKLIDRVDNSGLVIRSLNLKNIILSESYHKNDLFLINTFDLERKNQQSFSNYDFKYCSVGTHLKLKTSSKDTLESLCYLLMDFYKRGFLFNGIKSETQKQYLEFKTTFKLQGIPIVFHQFFEYVKNLNHAQQVKFTQWKLKLKKCVPQEDFHKPYEWITNAKARSSSNSNSSESKQLSDKSNTFHYNGNAQTNGLIKNENINRQTSDILQQENCFSSDEDYDNEQLNEGDLSNFSTVGQKMLGTDNFIIKRY